MGKKRRILLAALAAAVLGVLLWLGLSSRNAPPSGNRLFRGKPESVWIQNLKYHDDDQVKEWRGFGDDGVRVLIRALQRADHPHERVYRKVWRHTPSLLRRFLPSARMDSTRATRMTLLDLLSRLNKDAMIAEPAVARELEDEDSSVRAIAITYFSGNEDETAPLNRMDKKEKRRLLPYFIKAMQDSDWSVRNNILVALRYYPEEAQTVVPVLKKALQDPDGHVRQVAANDLKTVFPAEASKAGIK